MQLLVVVGLLAAVSASRLDESPRSREQPPEELCAHGATAANLGARALHDAPPCCPSLRKLYVHKNNITALPQDWLLRCPHLQEVSVSGNKLQRLPARLLAASSSLRRLQASRNLLENLPAELLNNATSLTELDLSHNQLKELPPGFLETNSQLEELYLQRNWLVGVPARLLAACARLRQLWLSHNRLPRLPEALLQSAPRLRVLRLDHNQLAAVDAGAFRNSQQLELADLSSNQLTSLPPGLFANAKSLRYLLLRDNRLRVVPAAGTLPGQPISLDLRDNHLPTVQDFGVFGSSRVWLDGNRWRCGCSLAPVLREAASARQHLWFQQRPLLCYQDDRNRRAFSEDDLSTCHIHETSPLLAGRDEAGIPLSHVFETANSRITSTENDTSPYRETITPHISSPQADFLQSSEADILEVSNTKTDGGNYNSATTVTVAGPLATTPDGSTSPTGSPQTDVNETTIFETNNSSDDYDESYENDSYGEPLAS